MARTKKRTVTLDDGRVMTLAEPTTRGMMPCPGEAHTNAYIDNCMTCLHHTWGKVPDYAPIDVHEETRKGLAVMFGDTHEPNDHEAFKRLMSDPTLEMIGAREKRKGCSSHFYVFVARTARRFATTHQ